MSSKISKINMDHPAEIVPKIAQDKQDDEHDQEIMDMFKTNQLVKQFTASNLTGREKLRYMKEQMESLRGKQKAVKTSLPIHLGMKKKAQERVVKKVEHAKNVGIYTDKLEQEFLHGEKALKNSLNKKKQKIDSGLVGSVGKYKKGVMVVSKKVIEAVENGKKKSKKGYKSRGPSLGGHGNRKQQKKPNISF